MGLRGNSAGDCLSVVGQGEMGRDDGGSVARARERERDRERGRERDRQTDSEVFE